VGHAGGQGLRRAARYGIELGEDIWLLEDVGWAEDDSRSEFELTMPPHDLMKCCSVSGAKREWFWPRRESVEDAETTLTHRRGYETCEQVLADLDPRAGERT
jgi:hypothetical protein